jgi:50S ribosomal protein L16 3-hydroxylase
MRIDVEEFVRVHWEKRPAVFRGAVPPTFLTSAGTFRAAVEAVRGFVELRHAPIRFYEGTGLRQVNLREWLPRDDDASFAGYGRRLEPALGGRGFSLVVNNLQRFDFDYWCRLRRVLRPLYERVGVPSETADADLFVGTGAHTPFGMHKDRASNFCLVLEGRKRFLLWPHDVFRDRPDLVHTTRYDAYRDIAMTLEGDAGDVLYWPSSYWHVAESDGSLSVTSNVALYLHRPAHETVAREMGTEIIGRAAHTDPPTTYALSDWSVPAAIAAAARDAVDAATVLERRVRAAWLARASADGFTVVPDPLPDVSLTIADAVQCDPDFPIRIIDDGETCICASHGVVFETRVTASIRAAVEALVSGRPVAVTDLVDPAVDPLGAFQVLRLLERLASVRGVHKLVDGCGASLASAEARA